MEADPALDLITGDLKGREADRPFDLALELGEGDGPMRSVSAALNRDAGVERGV